MKRPIPTVKILGIMLLLSMFLNFFQVFRSVNIEQKLNNYAEECGDRTDAPK